MPNSVVQYLGGDRAVYALVRRNALKLLSLLCVLFTVLVLPAWAQDHHPASPPHHTATRKHTTPPARPASSTARVQVYPDLHTGIYHYPGTRWYGKTKEGAYMPETDAKSKGYRAAYNGQ